MEEDLLDDSKILANINGMNRHLLLIIATVWTWKKCGAYVRHQLPQRTYNFHTLGGRARRERTANIERQHQFDVKRRPSLLQAAPKSDDEIIEEARINILKARRKNIRQVLRAADGIRTLRLERGWVPEIDETTGKPVSDQKVAVSVTAFGIAMGAIVLRVGGRAALVSAIGLDAFLTDDVRDNVTNLLTTADNMDMATKVAGFVGAWILTKVLCFDAAGVVLALSSGILFGGVIPGALLSAAAATIGSTVAYSLAKADTPVRRKAEEIVQENPSLRGIDKVVSKDGLKAVLTLRLAPILPIPIGMYNYVYGLTNVKLTDFVLGIFLGSLKPYFLDSYLGFFGKEVLEGTIGDGGDIQDIVLLGVLGLSVLIGVFASQLATETWESVLNEAESEDAATDEEQDTFVREVFGVKLPQWAIDFQTNLKLADDRINGLVDQEVAAGIWNATSLAGTSSDPSTFLNSPEKKQIGGGVDFVASIFDGLVLSPILFSTLLKYADPLLDQQFTPKEEATMANEPSSNSKTSTIEMAPVSRTSTTDDMEKSIEQLQELRSQVERQIQNLDDLQQNQRWNSKS